MDKIYKLALEDYWFTIGVAKNKKPVMTITGESAKALRDKLTELMEAAAQDEEKEANF